MEARTMRAFLLVTALTLAGNAYVIAAGWPLWAVWCMAAMLGGDLVALWTIHLLASRRREDDD